MFSQGCREGREIKVRPDDDDDDDGVAKAIFLFSEREKELYIVAKKNFAKK